MLELKQKLYHVNALILFVWWMNMYNYEPSGWICVMNCYYEYACDKIWYIAYIN